MLLPSYAVTAVSWLLGLTLTLWLPSIYKIYKCQAHSLVVMLSIVIVNVVLLTPIKLSGIIMSTVFLSIVMLRIISDILTER
jgi:hypothetical protein